MKKIMTMVLLAASLAGCVHKMDIEQGNIISQQQLSRLHKGMTLTAVKNLLGEPVLEHAFKNQQVDYVYIYRTGSEVKANEYMTLSFRQGALVNIAGNMYSQVLR